MHPHGQLCDLDGCLAAQSQLYLGLFPGEERGSERDDLDTGSMGKEAQAGSEKQVLEKIAL